MKVVTNWESSGKNFKVGDNVVYWYKGHRVCGVVTSIEVCRENDGHVILDGAINKATDFLFVEFDKAHYRNKKLEELGIK